MKIIIARIVSMLFVLQMVASCSSSNNNDALENSTDNVENVSTELIVDESVPVTESPTSNTEEQNESTPDSTGATTPAITTQSPANVPTSVTPPTTNDKAKALNRALLGPLSLSEVSVFTLQDSVTPLVKGTTDTDGYFDLDFSTLLDDEYYRVGVTGGKDVDSNDDGVRNEAPIALNGVVSAVLKGKYLKQNDIRVTAVSDIAWQYISRQINALHTDEITQALGQIAQVILTEDINGDSTIDELDLIYFDPLNQVHKAALRVNYQTLLKENDEGDSVINTYHKGDTQKRDALLDDTFGSWLSLNAAKRSTSKYIDLTLIPFGPGNISSDAGGIMYDSDTQSGNKTSAQLERSDSGKVTLTASPKEESRILGWKGCSNVSRDLTTCEVNLRTDHQVEVDFGYKEVKVVSEFVDLSAADVQIDDDLLTVTVDINNTELMQKMADLGQDWQVAGIAQNDARGFLKKVTNKTVLSDTVYQLQTVDTTLEQVVQQGTVSYTKQWENGVLDNGLGKQKRSAGSSPGLRFIPEIEGVKLVPSDDPNSKTFTLQLGGGTSAKQNLRGKGEFILAQDVPLYVENGVTLVKAHGEFKFELETDFKASYGFISGLEHFQLINTLKITDEIKLVADLAEFREGGLEFGGKQADKIKLGSFVFASQSFAIGPVPVVITNTLALYLNVHGKITAEMTTGVKTEETLQAGLIYTKANGISVMSNASTPTWDFLEPNIKVEAEAQAGIGIEVDAHIYSLTGPALSAESYYKVKATLVDLSIHKDALTKPCKGGIDLALYSGITADLAWTLNDEVESILGESVQEAFEPFKVNLYKKEEPIYQTNLWGEGECRPAQIRLVGDPIYERVKLSSAEKFTRTYKIENVGGGIVQWKADYLKDGVLTFSKDNGSVKAGKFETITVTVDPTKIDKTVGERYDGYIQFTDTGVIVDRKVIHTKDVSIVVIEDSLAAPINFELERDAKRASEVTITWDYPESEPYRDLIQGYQIWRKEILPEDAPVANEPEWEEVSAIAYYEEKELVLQDVDTSKTYQFKINAYTNETASEIADAELEKVELVSPELKTGSGTAAHYRDAVELFWAYAGENVIFGQYPFTANIPGTQGNAQPTGPSRSFVYAEPENNKYAHKVVISKSSQSFPWFVTRVDVEGNKYYDSKLYEFTAQNNQEDYESLLVFEPIVTVYDADLRQITPETLVSWEGEGHIYKIEVFTDDGYVISTPSYYEHSGSPPSIGGGPIDQGCQAPEDGTYDPNCPT